MIVKFSIWRILADHLKTFKNAGSKQYRPLDFITFLFIPTAIAAGVTYYGYLLTKEIINALLTSLSVFAALLFNLLMLVYGLVQKNGEVKQEAESKYGKVRLEFLKEIYANISFCILITVIAIALLLVTFIGIDHKRLTYILTFFSYSLTAIFLFTLLMILRRVHSLLFKEL